MSAGQNIISKDRIVRVVDELWYGNRKTAFQAGAAGTIGIEAVVFGYLKIRVKVIGENSV